MPLSDLKLSLLAFPQTWDPNSLHVNLLVLPNADPLAPLIPTGPQFAGTALNLEAVVVIGLDALPAPSSLNTQTIALVATPPADAVSLFQKFKTDQAPASPPLQPLSGVRILKSLPESYTSSFAFEQPRTPFANPAEDFGCSLRAKDPGDPKKPPPPQTWSWGKFISFALRQPRFARELGLIYRLNLPLNPDWVKNGGWIYFRLDAGIPGSPYLDALPDQVKSYAARLPALAAKRPLFAATLFPVVDAIPNESDYDDVQIEAETYDDGFAKIVHVHQPVSTDAAIEDRNQVKPGTEAGIQIGWDDEQVTIWHNRSLKTALSTQQVVPDAIESPLGVLGYCVDVRETGKPDWSSLCRAKARIQYDPFDKTDNRDYGIEPVPVRSAFGGDVTSWLPRYFAQWRGKSLVVNDVDAYLLGGGAPLAASPALKPVLPDVQLLYGHDYEFRARLLDLTGGTPDARIRAIPNPGPATSAKCEFRRFLPPKAVTFPLDRGKPPAKIDSLSFVRPILGYPEFQFAGITAEAVVQKLIARIPLPGTIKILGVADPDVDRFQVAVEVRTPAHDVGKPGELDGPWRHVYFVERSFNSYPDADPVDGDTPVTVEFEYRDVPHISELAKIKPDREGKLPLPRARDIRIVITPMGRAVDNYWNNPATRSGMTSTFVTRAEAVNEDNLLGKPEDQRPDQIRAILLQPQNNLTLNLAQELRLDVNELTFKGPPGTRTVFGCSKALRHSLAPDNSTITFAAEGELLNKWIVVAEFDMDRDWTWDGLEDRGIDVFRDGQLIGTLEVRPTLSQIAIGDGTDTGPLADPTVRETTHLVFFDAVDPAPEVNGFPVNLTPGWGFSPFLKGAPSAANLVQRFRMELPLAVAPRQTPALASAGIALSPYTPRDNYSATDPRKRALWLEFTAKIEDPHDTIFARVLAYGPDPLMVRGLTYDLPKPEEPDLPIDPERIRVITPLSSKDNAGLNAMVELIKSPTSDVHYMLPLPAGISPEALELFGFWTYEFRVGHRSIFDVPAAGLWSTARARFGRPLRVTGVQHPAPTLTCQTSHSLGQVRVAAPFATPVLLNGKTLIDPHEGKPRTRIWIMLYAQVRQADGMTWRNVLLNHRHAETVGAVEDERGEVTIRPSRDVFGHATFNEPEIHMILHHLSLPLDSPLSVLAVELLPPRADEIRDEMGQNVGHVRILRTSPLIPIPPAC